MLGRIVGIPRLVCEYIAAGYRARREDRTSVKISDLLFFFFPWLWSMTFSGGSLADRRPWITFAAARFMGQRLEPESRVFEYGVGGSTLYFAQRAGELASAEHDAAWLDRTSREMRLHYPGARWAPQLAVPEPQSNDEDLPVTHPDSYGSTDPLFAGMSFRKYASAIDRYPHNYFDFVLIDGRARPSCFKHALSKVKIGGYVVLDNAERHQYAYVEQLAARLGFEKTEFSGPGPYNRYFWRTIVLRKTKRGFALNELDTKLEHYLDLDGGTFVEAGANDGVTQSNTIFFEIYRGWRGLLIEPVPDLARQCRLYRSMAKVEQAALVSREANCDSVTVRYAHLMSVVKGGMKSQLEEDAHIEAGMRVQNITTYEVEVPAVTLSALLDKYGMRDIDLLSLDVEGYELNALKGLDLSRHRPRHILVEARYRAEVHDHLSGLYELVAELSHHDLLYRLKAGNALPPPAQGSG